jgi:Cys-tRNA(Pro) deacylase
MQKLSPIARKVQDALAAHGLNSPVVELTDTTRTAQDAANALGCRLEQIVKSLVFKGKKTGQPVLVIASGANRVNTKAIAKLIDERVQMAAPEFVLETTGFAIGGVPPLAHANPLKTFIDEDLLQLAELWAAAGTSHAMFKLTPHDLLDLTGGQVVSIT